MPGLLLGQIRWEMLNELSVEGQPLLMCHVKYTVMEVDDERTIWECLTGRKKSDVPMRKIDPSLGSVKVYDGGFGPAP